MANMQAIYQHLEGQGGGGTGNYMLNLILCLLQLMHLPIRIRFLWRVKVMKL